MRKSQVIQFALGIIVGIYWIVNAPLEGYELGLVRGFIWPTLAFYYLGKFIDKQ